MTNRLEQLAAARQLLAALVEAADELNLPGSHPLPVLNARISAARARAEAAGIVLASGGVDAPASDFPGEAG
jgi:hypothetical protein